jgi:FecR-like protein
VSKRSWPAGPDRAAELLRRALDDAALRGPDDMTLRRGWTAVAEPTKPRRSRRWSWFAGGVASTAALAVVAALWLWPRSVATDAQPAAASSASTAPFGPSPAAPGTRRLTLEGGVEAQLGSSSIMRLEAGAPRVEAGEVLFSVPHRPPGHPFVVRADGYNVVVVGTRFGVAVDGHGVGVEVEAGVVEVRQAATDRRLARLSPTQSWHGAPVAEETSAPGGPQPAATTSGVASSGVAHSVVAPLDVAPSSASNPRRVRVDLRRRTAAPAVRALALATSEESSPAIGSAFADSAPSGAGDEAGAAAQSALAAGDAPRALQLYRALADRSGPAAENAAYAVGKVLSEHLGRPASAVAAWRRYRDAYPEGILRVEADVSIIETLARIGDSDEALGEANDFLRRRPDSERRAEIARLAGDLYRAHGDCRHAVGAYQIALGASRPRDIVEVASFHRAACLVQLGDAAGADAARAYLRAYPSGRFRGEAAALVNEGARSTDGRAPAP